MRGDGLLDLRLRVGRKLHFGLPVTPVTIDDDEQQPRGVFHLGHEVLVVLHRSVHQRASVDRDDAVTGLEIDVRGGAIVVDRFDVKPWSRRHGSDRRAEVTASRQHVADLLLALACAGVAPSDRCLDVLREHDGDAGEESGDGDAENTMTHWTRIPRTPRM